MQRTEAPRDDVPLAITAGTLALLVATFLPLASRTPAWPTELPHLPNDERAVTDEHRRELAMRLPPSSGAVFHAWDAWAHAAATGDRPRSQQARERFAEAVTEATRGARDGIIALRARAAERFLRGLDDPRAPLTEIARRHGLAGAHRPWYATRAARIAWFTMSWERNLAHPMDDGSELPITELMLVVPRSHQRAFTSWALDARCYEITGATGELSAAAARRCANLRTELIPVARGVDPRYRGEEALARADVMLALGLRRAFTPSDDAPVTVVDEVERANALAEAQAALVRAQERYARLLQRPHSPEIERHFKAVVGELGGDD